MLRDVFYYGNKPNVHPREKFAKNLDDARSQATTADFWIINEYCDYRGFDWDFDFEFLHDDDVWAEDHINVWPSQHQKDSGTWLCNTANKEPLLIYRADVEVVKHKNLKSDRWVELDTVNHARFDFSWHPDPTDPPYIYKWGSKFAPVQFKTCLEYHAPGATQIKYMDQIVELLPNTECWVEFQSIDKDKFDMSWRPDPMDPPMIYVWGNKYIDGTLRSTLEYHVPGATERKYMPELVSVLPEWDRWVEHVSVDKTKGFDFSWRPDPREPAYNYVWGNKYEEAELKPTLEYRMLGATEIKYMEEKVDVLPQWNRWVEVQQIDKDKFDMSWRPDPREPPYIYVWGNKYIDGTLRSTLEYHCPGATEIKYMTNDVAVMPEKNRWKIIESVKDNCFDFSWRPDPREPALIYVFGNEVYDAVKMPTIEYHCIGATERKYMDNLKASLAPNIKLYEHLEDSTLADYSWLPDPDSPPYIYAWGNQWNKPEDKISIQFVVQDATEVKYMEARSVRKPCMDNWIIPKGIDDAGFDYSWEPSPADPPFIYEFGTQWQKTGGPRYVVEGATEVKYIDLFKVKHLSSGRNWTLPTNIDVTDFDFSWHPDATSPPYIYVFPTQWALSGGPTYTVEGATEIKYVEDLVAKAVPDKTNWIVPAFIDEESFDFSWHPYAQDEPYIYQFGTQHQKTGGPVYKTPGVHENSAIKYIDTRILKATRLPSKKGFAILGNNKIQDFDYSWHPDTTDEPYIYVFGNKQYLGEIMPTIEYVVPGAKQIKYVNDVVATLGPNRSNWVIIQPINEDKFDFSWKPNPKDPPYIYVWGNPYIDGKIKSTIEYRVDEATEYKYMDSLVEVTPEWDRWIIPDNLDTTSFDFTWRPDPLEEPLLWQFGTQWQKTGGPRYEMPKATEIKYVDFQKAIALPNKKNWVSPADIEHKMFDYSWHPDNTESPFIYQFGTQWQKTGGPRYIADGATEIKYVDTHRAIKKPNKLNWYIPSYIDDSSFDFSWHPDSTDDPFNYEFTTVWQSEGGPVYKVEDASDTKYVTFPVAKTLSIESKWEIPNSIDTTEFDFSWHPHPRDPAYIYQFGTQWQKTGGPRYVVEGAKEVKYVDNIKAKSIPKPNDKNWQLPDNIEIADFDYSWHPDATETTPYIYVFGTQWALSGGPRYVVPGASTIKYIDEPIAKSAPSRKNWIVPDDIDVESFDFSWHPYAEDAPYIYQFGTQWQKTGGPKYIAPGADEMSFVKYIDTRIIKATKLANKSAPQWQTILSVVEFDYSWHPDDTDPAYVYVFGNQWNSGVLEPTVEYVAEGATKTTQRKYITDPVAKLAHNKTNWIIPSDIDASKFDFSWRPDAGDEPMIHQFGTQWQTIGGPQYVAPGADSTSFVKYVDTRIIHAIKLPNFTNWEIPANVDRKSFDFSWQPGVEDKPYIYEFGTQWHKTGGPRYVMPSAVDIKFVDVQKATVLPDRTNWVIPKGVDVSTFDFSWHPDSTAPKYVYQFGTLLDKEDGPKYITPNNDGEVVFIERKQIVVQESVVEFQKYYVETTLEDLIKQHPNEIFWALNSDLDYSEFNFDWKPTIEQAQYVHAFGSSESELTQTYLVNSSMWEKGFRELNWVEDKKLDDESLYKMFKKSDMFFVDRGNKESQERFDKLKQQFPTIQKTRYLNSWVDTINRCINRSTTNLCWIINSELDYTGFDFNYYPNPWQMKMVHVFGTQWSHWGTTFMVNRETFAEDTKYIKIIEHLSNLNFLKERRATATNVLYDIVYIDHGNMGLHEAGKIVIKYEESYFNTFKKLLDKLPTKKEHYIWICSSICDYNGFDFTYICDPFAREQLHVFPSDKQKFGDTFLVNVNKLRELISDMEKLEDYEKINYNQHQRTKRLPAPTIITEGDTHVSAIHTDFDWPYATLVTQDNKDIQVIDTEPMNLWSSETKNIIITSAGGTRITVPKEVKEHVKRELYDYPYIITNSKLAKSTTMDIVFLSNGETGADENYEHLLRTTHGLDNRVVRVDGVNGRVAAYHAAAQASNTAWMFTVFAKLKVSNKFDWNWQPDRLQIPKHYVFHAKNPVNGLVYGHQAMIAYNKKLTLANEGKGLDFTMDDEHEIVEINSGVANFNTDEWSTWRTAFREALKLRANTDDISKNRLEFWLTVGSGKFSQYSMDGATDAVQYYEEVNGDFDKLKLSYEWDWLRAFYDSKYK